MPPIGDRKSSNARAEKAWQLHIAGRTWREVAEVTGFNSPQSAQKAAMSWLKKNPPSSLEVARRANGDGIRQVRGVLMQAMAKAQARGEHRTVSELGRAVLDSFEKEAKLWGLFVVVPEEVNVNVTTVAAVLERAEADLLALAAGHRPAIAAGVIDAEVVEP